MSPNDESSKRGTSLSLSGALNHALDPVHHPSPTTPSGSSSQPHGPSHLSHDTTNQSQPQLHHQQHPSPSSQLSVPHPDQTHSATASLAPSPTTSSGHMPTLKRFASASFAKPLKLAGSIKRGISPAPPMHQGVAAVGSKMAHTGLVDGGGGAGEGGNVAGSRGSEQSSMTAVDAGNGNGEKTANADKIIQLKSGFKPPEDELPLAQLRIRVIKCTDLIPKDRNGLSDPYLTLSLPPTSTPKQTPPVKKSLNPVWGEKEKVTFDFPVYESLARVGLYSGRGVEVVVWDRDLGGMRKEYMGEVSVRLGEWFVPGGKGEAHYGWNENLVPISFPLRSSRRRRKVTGSVYLSIGLLPPTGETPVGLTEDWAKDIFTRLRRAGEQHGLGHAGINAGLMAVPAYEGIGTVKMKRRSRIKPKAARLQAIPSALKSALTGRHHKSSAEADDRDEVEDLSDDGSDSEGSDDLRDDGLDSSSDEKEVDYQSMGFMVAPVTSRNGKGREGSANSFSTVSSTATEHNWSGGTTVPGPKDGQPSTIYEGQKLSTSPERELAPLKTTFETPAIVEVPPSAEDPQPGYFDSPQPVRRFTNKSAKDSLMTPGLLTPASQTSTGGRSLRKRLKKSEKASKKGKGYNFGVEKNVLGIVMLEISGAKDLPRLKNSLKFSFDMDPFVVISFGKKVFRTRVIRHSLTPTWDEKMLFHVRRFEENFSIQFSLLDWDKVSGNDYIGSTSIPLAELVKDAPAADPKTGLYGEQEDGKHEMREFQLTLVTPKDVGWDSKVSPTLTLRAKYEPYDALRQRFWRQYLTQFDTDNTNAISFTELTTMLDSLNSTLTTSTLESYWDRFGKNADSDELTYDEIIQCLEDEIKKSENEKKKLSSESGTGLQTPTGYGSMAPYPAGDGLDEAGTSARPPAGVDADALAAHIAASRPAGDDDDAANGDVNLRPAKIEQLGPKADGQPHLLGSESPSGSVEASESEGDGPDTAPDVERLVNIKTCPLCHRPRLKRKSEVDILTHLAVCASADWDRVDRIVVGNYVTASQAQRKFLSKILTKVSAGSYSLGANSANIIVQDRMTGQLQEEKMAVYVRIGIRVLYKGAKKGMEGSRARKLLKSMSVKQGLKYNSPESRLEIPSFIAFHRLNVDEILEPLDSFKTFNEFFYRKLRADARPVTSPEDPNILVSCADCRMMAFETVSEATRIWVKGREFSVGRLLGDTYKDIWERYDGGALGIFRLAPQDYHRFHSPVDGVVGKPARIDGQYYTVNPQAIRTTLDVYGENVREVWPIHSPQFGTVMTVWIGAMMVGSIGATVKEGDHVKRGDELGWFAFGGSTLVCLFERGALKWDEDIQQNSAQAIETLVRMGMAIGRSTMTQNDAA